MNFIRNILNKNREEIDENNNPLYDEDKQIKADMEKVKREEKASRIERKNIDKREKDAQKDVIYIQKKNTSMKILRVVAWFMIFFVFVRGIISVFRPDPTEGVTQMIEEFQNDFDNFKDEDSQILGFAQTFAVNYFTYNARGESEYKDRLAKYAVNKVANASYSFGSNSASVLYASAYKKEFYDTNQYDVYVDLNVEYVTIIEGEKQSKEEVLSDENQEAINITEQVIVEPTTIKVPLVKTDTGYIVVDFPAFIFDNNKAKENPSNPSLGLTSCSEGEAEAIKVSLSNFFVDYYSSTTQEKINYYLTPEANQSDFIGLAGRIEYEKIIDIKAYYAKDQPTNEYVALVTVLAKDKNGISVFQSYNFVLLTQDNKYYIKSMEIRV